MKWKCLIILSICIVISKLNYAQQIPLHNNWKFTQQNKNNWLPATVPGCVHTDLLANHKIENPYFGSNENNVQWVNTTNFIYQTSFNLKDSTLRQQHINIVLEGIDTYASIYVNDTEIGKTNNMFIKYTFDIKKLVRAKNNILKIVFIAAQTVVDSLAKNNTNTIPDNNRLYARKAAYQFGWDFAPKLTTCGIWKPIYINAWSKIKVEKIITNIISMDINTKKSKIALHCYIQSDSTTTLNYYYTITEKSGTSKIDTLKKMITLQRGMHIIMDTIIINNSKLWQPNGIGKANMYTVSMHYGNQQMNKAIGLRTIELITKPDSVSDFKQLHNKTGTGFYFKVNGKPIYINGANYVPMDMFPSSVKKEKYCNLIKAAKDANINMLRVWGGGIYENDIFYELCNEAGIMVWQDFMFAGNMLPTDTNFHHNIKLEATQQVERLHHHPCIALWCGNNEIDEAWHNWGWQKQFNITITDSIKLWDAYTNIFKKILPTVVTQISPSTAYWQSSPSVGWGKKESLTQGDCHYWGVWWGLEPIKNYQLKVPRFMSEYGMQSMPSMYTIAKFSNKKDWDTASKVMKLHQKHPTGFQNIATYLKQEKFNKAGTFKEYVLQTQLLQAKAYSTAIQAHHRTMPYNMGTMLWQLNDPWPVASWSIIDYYLQKKTAYFTVKKLYKKK